MAQTHEWLFRTTGRGREPLSAPEEGGSHVHYQPTRRAGIGSITSTPPGRRPLTFFEYLAIRSGMTLAEVTKLHDEGKIH